MFRKTEEMFDHIVSSAAAAGAAALMAAGAAAAFRKAVELCVSLDGHAGEQDPAGCIWRCDIPGETCACCRPPRHPVSSEYDEGDDTWIDEAEEELRYRT